jgi:hypothetical protein
MTRLINNPETKNILQQMKDIDISTYDLFKIILELDEGRPILSMLLDEYPDDDTRI